MRVAVIVLSVVLLAGCGGDDRLTKEEYQSEVRGVGQTLTKALSGAGTMGEGGLEKIGSQVDELQVALRSAADDLDGLTPPEDVEGAHDKLIDGIRGFADDMEKLGEAVEKQDLGAISEFEQIFTKSESVTKIREAADELQDKGYTIQ